MKYVAAANVILPAMLLIPSSALAWGALAVGVPPDVVHQGMAYGIANDLPTEADAQADALNKCRTAPNTTDMARNLCTLVESYSHQCAVVVWDPGNGTPGAGWSVAPTRDLATEQATNNCKATAGADRQQYCAMQGSYCDTQP